MSYEKKHYDRVFKELKIRYGISYPPQGHYVAAMTAVKRIFDDNFTIAHIFSVLDEASEKGKWPIGTTLWRRVHDLLLLQRKQLNKAVEVDTGLMGIAALLRERQ